MLRARLVRRAGCLLLLVCSGLVAAAGSGPAASRLAAVFLGSDDHAPTLSGLLADLAACVTALAVLALCLSGAVVVVTAGSSAGARVVRRLCPTWWWRVVLLACGVGLATPGLATAGVAHAPDPACPPHCVGTLDGLPMPELPRSCDEGRVVVRPGDSLWQIAESRLGDQATPGQILHLVDAIHAANGDVLGDDPDLIFPGTHLTIPGGN